MNSTTYVTLDLQAPNLAVVVAAKQNDTLGRQIAATLRDGSAAFDATGLLCEIRYAKPDGTVGFYDTLEDNTTPAYTIDGNVVTFTLAEQMLTIAGAVYVDVNFYAATGEKLTAFAFVLQVEASVLSDGTIESSDYYNVLTATLAEAAEIAANLPVPYTGLPENLGTPSSGAAVGFSRGDHVHAMPSAADVGALTSDDVHYKVFSGVAQISDSLVAGSATLSAAYTAMPSNSIYIGHCTDFSTNQYPSGTSDGSIEIVKVGGGWCGYINWYGRTANQDDFRMYVTGDPSLPTGTWIPTANATISQTLPRNTTYISGTDYAVYIYRTGNVVSVSGRFTTPYSVPENTSIFTIPDAYKGNTNLQAPVFLFCSLAGGAMFPVYTYGTTIETLGDVMAAGYWVISGSWIVN